MSKRFCGVRACMHDYCINYEIITHTCDHIIAGLGVISTSYMGVMLVSVWLLGHVP